MLRFAVAALACSLVASSALAASTAEVVIQNNSQWQIHNLYISPTSTDEWGEDQLGEHVIETGGGTYTLTDIPCAAYDVRLIDEDGDECVVTDVGLCGGKGNWVIEDEALLACQNAE